jgi:hypothetical protein
MDICNTRQMQQAGLYTEGVFVTPLCLPYILEHWDTKDC